MRNPVLWRRLALVASGWGLLQFVVTAVVLQFVRADLDPWTSTLSQYLVGPGGGWLVAAYVALALGLVLFGLGAEGRADGRRPAFDRGAYVAAGLGVATAGLVRPSRRIRGAEGLWRLRLHLLGSGTAFVALALVALRTSWAESGPFPPGGRRRAARLLSALAAGLELVYAVASPKGGGSYEKVLIILLALWTGLRWTAASCPLPARNRG